MDIDTLLENLFEEYKTKAILEGKNRKLVEEKLELVREEAESRMRETLEEFVGRPNNITTLVELRNAVNQDLNQFLDTDIVIDSIEQDINHIDINMTYTPKKCSYTSEKISVHSGVTILTDDPVQELISFQL
jgi:hypothetical protein